jgi:hypothetical protein
MPTEGSALTVVALSATLHCLTGCAIGEVTGMIIGTALGFSDLGTIALAVALAFLFGYTLTSIPLLRAGLALGVVIPIALASDTISIAIMEVVDNGIMLIIPGAMEAGVGDVLFWGALSFALVIAGLFALPANRWLIARGKGHTAVHETGIHGGPPVRVVGAVAVVAFVFGAAVLANEAISGDDEHDGGHENVAATESRAEEVHGGGHADGGGGGGETAPDPVRGLAVSESGMTLELDRTELPRGEGTELAFQITGVNGETVRDFEVEHTKRMHLIVARRDMAGFQHLHPRMSPGGTWSTEIALPAGSYRVFADFKRAGESTTLAADLAVDGSVDWKPIPSPAATARAGDGYSVTLDGHDPAAGGEAEVAFSVSRKGAPVEVESYLGADGHLVALREGDLAYLHTHPSGNGGGEAIRFATEFPTAGRYRLFLQFRDRGKVRTAVFTLAVGA